MGLTRWLIQEASIVNHVLSFKAPDFPHGPERLERLHANIFEQLNHIRIITFFFAYSVLSCFVTLDKLNPAIYYHF